MLAMHALFARDVARLFYEKTALLYADKTMKKHLLPRGYNFRWGGCCLLAAITSCNSTLDQFRRLLPPSVTHDPGSGVLNWHGQYTGSCRQTPCIASGVMFSP